MKKITTYFFTAFLLCFISTVKAQSKTEIKKNVLEGIWMLKAEKKSNNLEMGYIPSPPATFKIISSDGKFINFSTRGNNAVIGTDGLCHIESDSIYIETIERSVIPSLVGKNNKLIYKLNNNKLFLKFYLEKNSINQTVNIWIEEIWEKIEMPKTNPNLIR